MPTNPLYLSPHQLDRGECIYDAWLFVKIRAEGDPSLVTVMGKIDLTCENYFITKDSRVG